MSSARAPPGFLGLPVELRGEIYQYLLLKDIAVVTMLLNCNSEISAAQPQICYVNKQIRAETLPIFYRGNNFTAELQDVTDVETVEKWLTFIGEESIRHLRHVQLIDWTMASVSLTSNETRDSHVVKCILNPKAGTFEVRVTKRGFQKDGEVSSAVHWSLEEVKKEVEGGLTGLVRAGMDAEAAVKVVLAFHWLVGRC